MTKKIKFPLFMKESIPVRTIEELRDNFDSEKILEYYYNKKLFTWLKDRSYLKELKQLKEVDCQEKLLENICNIFSVKYNNKEISVDVLLKNSKKLVKLQQFTDDINILSCIDKVAFCQEELIEILQRDENVIYLCDNKFYFNCNIYKKTFFGIGKVKVIIENDNYEDLLKKALLFNNILLLDTKEEPIVTVRLEDAEKLYFMYNIEEAIPLLMQLSELNNARAQFILGIIYSDGLCNIQVDQNKAMHFFELGEGNGDILCKFHKCLLSKNHEEILYNELLEPLKKEAESNNVLALYDLGLYFLQNHKNNSLELLARYSKLAADKGYWRAWRTCGLNYEFGRGVEINYYEAKKYYQKVAEIGDLTGKLYLGELLVYKLNELEEGCKWLKDVYNSETVKARINDLFFRIDNIEYQYLGDDPSVNRFKMVLDHKTFSSKKEAAHYIDLKFENYCQELNKTFSIDNPRFKILEEYYICSYNNIINDANKLIYILNNLSEKNNIELIINKKDSIKDSLRQLLIKNQKSLETSGFYYEPYTYIYDCTEHNGFFNVTKYWIDTCIGIDMKEHIKYDNTTYSYEAIEYVKSILKDELSYLNNYC